MRDAADEIRELLQGSDGQLVIGPLVLSAENESYFLVAASMRGDGFFCIKAGAESEIDRMGFLSLLIGLGPKLVAHIMNDEIAMAKLCETLWPCKRTHDLRADFEADEATRRTIQ